MTSCKENPESVEPQPEPTPTPVKPEDGQPIELENVTVTLTSLHAGDVFLSIEPKDQDMTYWYSLQVDEDKVVAVTTGRAPMNTFEVSQGTVEDDRATFYVAPAHNESYVALFELQEYLFDAQGNPLSDEEIMEAILAAQGTYISNHAYTGTASVFECPLIPNKDYYCLVFGYFGGEITTPLTKVAFTTKEADAFDAEILVTVAEVTKTDASIWFQPYREPMPSASTMATFRHTTLRRVSSTMFEQCVNSNKWLI